MAFPLKDYPRSGNRAGEFLFGVIASSRPLSLLGADAGDGLDRHRRAAGFFGDLAVLLEDVPARRRVALKPAEQFRRHPAVRALRAVLIDDIGDYALDNTTWSCTIRL